MWQVCLNEVSSTLSKTITELQIKRTKINGNPPCPLGLDSRCSINLV